MIAIVVLTHNRVHLLRQCVENVLGRTSDRTSEIVIWNNGSTDGTQSYLEELDDPRIQAVHHPRNTGQNAYAEAFRLTTAPFMIELDDDMIDAPSDWDKSLLEAYERLPNVGFLAARLVDNPHDQTSQAMYRDRPHLYYTKEINGVSLLVGGPVGGTCAMTARELHNRVGGFRQHSKRVFWLEDEAYIRDIEKLGYEAAYLRDLEMLHAGGTHYAAESEAKSQFWSDYARRQQRKTAVKRFLLRLPFVRRLNARFGWFQPPDTRGRS
jgi:GT2 family glycosyltransferase